jgi:hypothetical protein
MRVARLADEIDQAVWLEGITVIEEELLTVYTAKPLNIVCRSTAMLPRWGKCWKQRIR